MNVWRERWTLPADVTYLNHGSFGPTPQAVQTVQREWAARLASEPMDFFLRQQEDALSATAERLSGMARQGEWQAMGDLITDAMLDAFAVTGTWAALPGIVQARYAGRLLDRVAYYLPYLPGEEDAGWAATLAGFKG